MNSYKKHALSLAFLFSILVPSPRLMAQTRMAHADFNSLVQNLPEITAVSDSLNLYAQSLENHRNTLRAELQQKQKTLDSISSSAHASVKRNLASQIERLQNEFSEFSGTAQAEIDARQRELFKPLIAKVKRAAADVAKKMHYDYVTDSASPLFIYTSSEHDITDAVKKVLQSK